MFHSPSTTQSRIWSGSTMTMSGLVGYLHFGDTADMLYSELITEHFNAVNAPNFGSRFVSQGHLNLSTFQFLIISRKCLVTIAKTIWILGRASSIEAQE